MYLIEIPGAIDIGSIRDKLEENWKAKLCDHVAGENETFEDDINKIN